MEWAGWLGLGALAALYTRFFRRNRVEPEDTVIELLIPVSRVELEPLYRYWGAATGVDPALLRAVAFVESSENSAAVNPKDPSYGLGQVLCVADGPNERCRNELPAVPDFKQATPQKLMDPDFNLRIYSQILAWNIAHWPGDLERAIVAYNNWSAAVAGRGADGRFYGTGDPQGYLERVLEAYDQFRTAGTITV